MACVWTETDWADLEFPLDALLDEPVNLPNICSTNNNRIFNQFGNSNSTIKNTENHTFRNYTENKSSEFSKVEPSMTRSTSKNSNKWSETGDIFLTGIVMSMYYARHSLKPTNKEKMEAQRNNVSCEKIIWGKIDKKYEVARKRFNEMTGNNLPARSLTALQKRWKEQGSVERQNFLSHSRFSEDEYVSITKKREREWENVFNKDGILSCRDEIYSAHLKLLNFSVQFEMQDFQIKKQRLD